MKSNQSIDGKQSAGSHYQKENHSRDGRDVHRADTRKRGRVGNVAVGIGGTFASPPLPVNLVKRYSGDVKSFPETDELIDTSSRTAFQ